MTNKNERDPKNLAISKNILNNLNYIIKKSGLTKIEIAAMANIPTSTLGNITGGHSINPEIHTLGSIARVFNVSIAQIIGELPINSVTNTIPLLKWSDVIKTKGKSIFKHKGEPFFITTSVDSQNFLFAVKLGKHVSDIYEEKSMVVVEQTESFINSDHIIVQQNNNDPSIKQVIKDGNDIFLANVSNTYQIPLQKYDKETYHILGVVRETRI